MSLYTKKAGLRPLDIPRRLKLRGYLFTVLWYDYITNTTILTPFI